MCSCFLHLASHYCDICSWPTKQSRHPMFAVHHRGQFAEHGFGYFWTQRVNLTYADNDPVSESKGELPVRESRIQ